MKKFFVMATVLTAMLIAGCATYYQKTLKFQSYIMEGDMEKAGSWLQKNDKDSRGKNKLLYFMYRGWVNRMLGNYQGSNNDLEVADLMIEDFHKQAGFEALALISNPGVRPYQAEDFEKVMVNYYKALNYISLGRYEEARVEARRIIIRLQELNSQYKDRKNRYSDDAFAHIIIGMVYEIGKDYNNAFIAYRNALKAYDEVYTPNFGVEAPLQLKKDILRTAWLSGFSDELAHYGKIFGMDFQPDKTEGGQLVFIWHNGFGPVKSEWSINFTMVPGEAGFVTFVNEEHGITLPFYIGDRSKGEQAQLRDLRMVRVAFPKYVERKPVFSGAYLEIDGQQYPLELAGNINNVAFRTLEDRMMRELGNALLRVAVKQALEQAAREATKSSSKENKVDAGDIAPAAITILNALTEKADTRNWQTLPHSIYYTRIKLAAGPHSLTLNPHGRQANTIQPIELDIIENQTTFYVFSSLDTYPPEY